MSENAILSDEQFQLLSDRIEAMVKGRFDEVLRKLTDINNNGLTLLEDRDIDAKKLSEISIMLSTTYQTAKETKNSVDQSTKKTIAEVGAMAEQSIDDATKKVEEAVEPAMAKVIKKIRNGLPLQRKKILGIF